MELSETSPLGHLHAGFVAMEYFALILNRSFLFLMTNEGLQGWKFCGPVTTRDPLYYKPIEALLDDPEYAPGSPGFTEIMQQRGTFCIRYSEIQSVDFVGRLKWGMSPIPHCGRLVLRLFNGKKREFILLGDAYGEGIRNAILANIPPA